MSFCYASQPGVISLDKGSAIESKVCDFQNFDVEQIFFLLQLLFYGNVVVQQARSNDNNF